MLRFRLDSNFVVELEETCLEFARYANQNLEEVESWPLPVLLRRYRAMARIISRETGQED